MAVIRTSADWEAEKVKNMKQKKKNKKKKGKTTHEQQNQGVSLMANNPPSLPSVLSCSSSDVVWCGPGVGFSGGGADDAAPVDCVVTGRNVASRGKLDGADKINHREILMIQSGLLMGGRLGSRDQFRDWRLNIYGMTYEELLALGDKIGYVSTGLTEHEMNHCLRKIKGNLSSNLSGGNESKCSICQEEYEADDEMGKLNCGHSYHMDCIKQWLLQRNACPACKSEVVARR